MDKQLEIVALILTIIVAILNIIEYILKWLPKKEKVHIHLKNMNKNNISYYLLIAAYLFIRQWPLGGWLQTTADMLLAISLILKLIEWRK